METFNDLANKVAVITGANSGMGKAIAQKLSSHGAKVFILGINRELGINTAKELGVTFIETDVTSKEAIQDAATHIGAVHILINVAGISLQEQKGVISPENFDKIIAVNLKSVYLTSLIFGHHLMCNNGAIVNVSSIRAKTGTPSYSSAYAASKAGVENLTKSFALELAEKNIRVNAIAPGATFPTKMSEKWNEKDKKEIIKKIPLKRLGSPVDMANGVYFLVSDLSSYITGQTLNINGGAWMG